MRDEKKPLGRRIAEILGIAVLLPVIVPLALIVFVLYWAHRLLLYLLIWCVWVPRGKDALVVYSDSPIWRETMIEEIIPLFGERAVVLNWSERSQWPRWSLATHIFRTFGGSKEFNPMVVLFRPFRAAEFFRFWMAFKEWKDGNPAALDALQRELRLSVE